MITSILYCALFHQPLPQSDAHAVLLHLTCRRCLELTVVGKLEKYRPILESQRDDSFLD